MTDLTPIIKASWLNSSDVQQLFHAFAKGGAIARIVGGAVRDSLRGAEVKDIDLAINTPPEETMKLLEKAGITAVPTGIEYGTITAVINKTPYQVTTLRKDVETFGRKASVEFTDDWVEDAKRRDFTINAMYADSDGKIYDPCGGIEDLKNQVVRFIGKPEERIQEDYLRILRFFRFNGLFLGNSKKASFDEEGLTACHKYASKLSSISKERITEEFLKILSLPYSHLLLEEMTPELGQIFKELYEKDFRTLISLDKFLLEIHQQCTPLLKLALLAPDMEEIQLLNLSNDQKKMLRQLIEHRQEKIDDMNWWLYYRGAEITKEILFLNVVNKWASRNEFSELSKKISSWQRPEFPLKGEDLMKLGVPKGERLGELLRQTEEWWVREGFKPNKEECVGFARELTLSP